MFFRRAGQVAVRLENGTQAADLIGPGKAFAGFSVVKEWTSGVVVLRAPEEEVARQMAEPGRAQAWLDGLRSAGHSAMANPVLVDPESGLMMVPFGQIIVRLNEGVDAKGYFGADFGKTRKLEGTTDQFVLPLATSDFETTVLEVTRRAAQAEVRWVEPDFMLEVRLSSIPTDPLYQDQWHLGGNTSAIPGYGRAGRTHVQTETAWDTTRGTSDVVVAVLDDAFDTAHEDLAPNLFINPGEIAGNGIDDDNNSVIDDISGWDFNSNDNDTSPGNPDANHGTAVAGVAIARADNGLGGVGAAPGCGFMPMQTGGASSDFATTWRYVAGLTGQGWRGADLLNMSFSMARDQVTDDALADVAKNGRQGRGLPMLASSGNSASNYNLVGWALTAGTHTFEWRYTKNGSVSVGEDAAFIDNVQFFNSTGPFVVPEYGSPEFSGGSPGFTSSGAKPWTIRTGTDRARGSVDSISAKSGAITHGQTSSLFYTKTMPAAGQIRFYVWLDSEAANDTLQFFIDGAPAAGGKFSGPSAAVNGTIGYPASHPDVMAVGASSDYDLRVSYSQYSPDLEMLAPSAEDISIVTTDRSGASGYDAGNYSTFRNGSGFSGTSSSSPLATGVTALALSVNPWLTRKQVRSLIHSTSDKIGGVAYDSRGFNLYYGYGRVNAAALVAAARGPQLPGYSQNFNAIADNVADFNDGSSFYANKQRVTSLTVAGWSAWSDFTNHTADTGTPANAGVSALSTMGGTSGVVFSDAGDGAGQRAFCNGWESGSGTKAWVIPVNSANLDQLKVSFKLMSTNSFFSFAGPRDFKTQYTIDGTNWTDIGTLTAGNGVFSTYGPVSLPGECGDQAGLKIRILMTSNIAVTGGAVTAGQCHLDDILVTGEPMYLTAGVKGGALQLHEKASTNVLTNYVLPNLGSGVTDGFEATFRYKINAVGVTPGDGFSVNYGPLRDGVNGGVEGFGKGLSVEFRSKAGEARHAVRINGVIPPGGQSAVPPATDNAWHSVRIRWGKTAGTGQGTVTLSVDEVALLRDLPVDFVPTASDSFAFAASNGANSEDLLIDDVSVQPVSPERFAQTFDAFAPGTTDTDDGTSLTASSPGSVGVGTAAGRTGYRLANDATFFNLVAWVLPQLGSACTQGFEAEFKYYMASASPTPADGFAFNFANPSSTNSGPGGLADGLAVSFDIYSSNSHRALLDGGVLPGGTNPAHPLVDGAWHPVRIRWEKTATSNGLLTVTVDGVEIFKQLPTLGFNPSVTDRFVFTAFTGALTADILIDDVSVKPLFTYPFPVGPMTIRSVPNASPGIGVFPMRWGSVPGRNHRLESSTDLLTWTTEQTRTGVDGFDFVTIVTNTSTRPKCFYRVVREP